MLAYDWNFLGLSSEVKPMSDEKVVDGSTFYECDTCDFYIFYQGEWYKQTFVTENGINVYLYKSLMKKMFGKLFDSNITTAKIIKPDTGTNIEFTANLPAQIIDLTGYGDSEQQTYTGKNLLYIPSGTSTSNGITWTKNGNTVSGTTTGTTGSYSAMSSWLNETLPAGTYTFSIGEAVTKRVQFARRVDSSSSAQTVNLPVGDTSITFTNDEATYQYHVVLLDTSGATLTDYTIKDIQLEAGSEATSFEPYVGGIPAPNPDYPQDVQVVTGEQTVTVSDEDSNSQTYTVDLGTIELVKIDDSQDYIYKSGDDWYLHKETATIASYDGESISTDYLSTTGQLTTGATVYYVLNTPTNTKITDATLTSQLNAILEYTFPAGVNTIVITADELPMPLKLIISEKE